MNFYFNKTPYIFQKIFKKAIWSFPKSLKYYLTFDDGPDPHSTPYILSSLKQKNIKATFFCLGCNVQQFPDLFSQILEEGHAVGNHGYNHISGWNTSMSDYLDNLKLGNNLIRSNLFRPPYGRMKWRQYVNISKEYKIILWNNMPGDFDQKLNPTQLQTNFYRNLSPGSIIALHDSPQSLPLTQSLLLNIEVDTNMQYDKIHFHF